MAMIPGFDAVLKQGDGATAESFTAIANVRDITGPSLSVEIIEDRHRSLTNDWVEKFATFLNGGQVTFDISYDPVGATHDASTGLIADMEAKTLRNFELDFGDTAATTWTFSAYVSGFEPGNPLDGAATASVTLDISGEPTLA